MKKLIVRAGVLVAVGVAVLPLVSMAAYFNAGKAVEVGGTQAINQNAYVAGAQVTFSAPVTGDLLAAGATLNISSKVTGDIMAAGANMMITGASAQDMRVAGANLTVGSTLSGELVAAGANVTVTPDTTIAKDSYIRGASVIFNGDEKGSLDVAGASVTIGGTIENNVKITATKDVTIAPGAIIKGNLDYTAPTAATIASGARILGTTTFHQAAAPAPKEAGPAAWLGPFAALATLAVLFKFLMVLLVAYLIWYIFRNDALAMLEGATRHFWKSLLRGFVFLVALPAAVIIALITVVGVIAGAIAALVYVALILLAAPVAVLFTSSLLMKLRTNLRWYHILLGAVVLQVVGLIPFIGWLACLVVWLTSFGALLAVVGKKFTR